MAIQGVNTSTMYTGSNVSTSTSTQPTMEQPKVLTNTTGPIMMDTRGKQASDQMVKDAVNEANSKLKISNRRCQFTYEKDINRVSVKLIDESTGEVIREIPSEETLDMIRRLKEMTGLLIDEQR